MTFRASSAQRLALCPGSARAEAGLPETTSPDAEAGTRMHAIIAAIINQEQFTGLTPTRDELDTASLMIVRAEAAIGERCDQWASKATEARVARGVWTGHVDLVVVPRSQDCKHVVDWKTGWGDVPDAADNAQMRAYACMVTPTHDPVPVHCHVVTRTGITSTVYDAAGLATAWQELEGIARDAYDAYAQRIPCPAACKYCRAFGNAERCHESVRLIPEAAEVLPRAVAGVQGLVPAKLAELLTLAALVEKLAKKVRDEAKRRLEADPSSVPGWALKPGATRRTVADARKAVDALVDAGLPESQAVRALAFSIPEAAAVASDALNLKRRDGEAWVLGALAAVPELVESKTVAPSLVERKP